MTAYPSPDLPAPRRRSRVPVVIGIILTLLVLSIGGCVALFLSGSKATSEAKVSANQFLTTLEQGDDNAAQKLLARQTQAQSGNESVAEVMEVLQKRHGKARGHDGPQGWRVNTMNGVTQVRMAYLEHFEKGQMPVEITCVEEGGKWAIASFNFRL